MRILIVGLERSKMLLCKFCREQGIAVEQRLGPENLTQLVVGPMGIMRPAKDEVVMERLRRELNELNTMNMTNVIAIVCGAQPHSVPTNRFSMAKMLAEKYPDIPIVVTERNTDLEEVTRYYGGVDAVCILSSEAAIIPGKIHIVAPKAPEKTPAILLAFIAMCHARATSAS